LNNLPFVSSTFGGHGNWHWILHEGAMNCPSSSSWSFTQN
jgi:hypothetical protein